MFAIGHAAAALAIKRRYPSVEMTWILVSVQFVEFLWVGLNLLGIERTTTEPLIQTVGDIHLAYMPYSHSIGSALLIAAAAWLFLAKGLGRPHVGAAVGIGIISHIALDLLVHGADVVLLPGLSEPKLGLGLYNAPLVGFAVEMAWGLVCWRIYQGGPWLLATIVGFNLANLSFFSAAIPGPEALLAGQPQLIVLTVLAQIVVTLTLVGILARRERGGRASPAPHSPRPQRSRVSAPAA